MATTGDFKLAIDKPAVLLAAVCRLRYRVCSDGRSYNFAVYAFAPDDFHADEM